MNDKIQLIEWKHKDENGRYLRLCAKRNKSDDVKLPDGDVDFGWDIFAMIETDNGWERIFWRKFLGQYNQPPSVSNAAEELGSYFNSIIIGLARFGDNHGNETIHEEE